MVSPSVFLVRAIAILGGVGEFVSACTQGSSYGDLAPIGEATSFKIDLEWHNMKPLGHVFMSTATAIGYDSEDNDGDGHCFGGYFGAQFHGDKGNTWLFSMASTHMNKLFPVGPHCRRDCFDCGGEPKDTWKDVQCTRKLPVEFGVTYGFTLYMTMQNSSGAEWAVEVEDVSSNRTFEIGRMYFADPSDSCRRVNIGSYSFQENFGPFQQFTRVASWSGAVYSGVMTPMTGAGYCNGHRLKHIKHGITQTGCQEQCASNPKCQFASYSSRDHAYSHDGRHCILFKTCDSLSDYLKSIWTTARKNEAVTRAPFTGYCNGHKIKTIKGGISQEDCNQHCVQNSKCNFASYSWRDRRYVSDGKHCMLYETCLTFSDYCADKWITYQKTTSKGNHTMKPAVEPRADTLIYPAVKQDSCCANFDGWGETGEVSEKHGGLSVLFSAGTDVGCISANYEQIGSGPLSSTMTSHWHGIRTWAITATITATVLSALALWRTLCSLSRRSVTETSPFLATSDSQWELN